MAQQAETFVQGVGAVEFGVERRVVLAEIARRVVQPAAEPVGRQPEVELRIVVAGIATESRVFRTGFPAQAVVQAMCVAQVREQLRPGTTVQPRAGGEGAGIPAVVAFPGHAELRRGLAVAQRHAAEAVVGQQRGAARHLRAGVGSRTTGPTTPPRLAARPILHWRGINPACGDGAVAGATSSHASDRGAGVDRLGPLRRQA